MKDGHTIKVLDRGYVKLIESWGSDERIVESARMSTAKGVRGWGPLVTGMPCYPNGEYNGQPREVLPEFLADNWNQNGRPDYQKATNPYRDVREEPGDEKLLKYLWDHKHTTPFEMAGITIEVKAPIMVFREWHRHRTQSYSEMSARYVPLPNDNYVPDAGTVHQRALAAVGSKNRQAAGITDKAPTMDDVLSWLADELLPAYERTQRAYEKGLALGIPKEIARLPVPVGRYSCMRASANLLNWTRFLTLRAAKDAQWEIREYSTALLAIVHARFPRTYEVASPSILLLNR